MREDTLPGTRKDLDRHVHQAYAEQHGYFWAPCPGCGEMHGGHEPVGKRLKTPDVADIPNMHTWTCESCAPRFDDYQPFDGHPRYLQWRADGSPQPWEPSA